MKFLTITKRNKKVERQQFNERIQHEFDEFKATTLQFSKEEIFDKGFEIDLKGYITNYLTSEDTPLKQSTIDNLSTIDGNVLDYLCDIYLNNDTYYTYDDLCEEILDIFDSEFFEEESQGE